MDPEMIPSDCEDEAPVAMKRCTVKSKYWRCKNWFAATDSYKFCPHHREKARRDNHKPINKQRNAKRAKTEVVLRKNREYSKKPESKLKRKERQSTPDFRSKRRVYLSEYKKTPQGRMAVLSSSLQALAKGWKTESLIRMGCFESSNHVKKHFESTWDKSWMTWENHGRHLSSHGYGVRWHFGHKLPCAIFDGSNPNDRRKCFMPMNLYAQDAKENSENLHKLVYSDDELLALRPCWPDAAKNSLVLLKALFAGAAARAVAEGSSSSTHSAAAGSEAAAPAEDSEAGSEADSEVESAGETEAEETEAED